jgi:hypothetical protein
MGLPGINRDFKATYTGKESILLVKVVKTPSCGCACWRDAKKKKRKKEREKYHIISSFLHGKF